MLASFSLSLLSAATIPLYQIPLGKVVSVNGLKFIKTGSNDYMAITEEPLGFIPESMQDFAARNGCDDYPIPDNPFDFTLIGNLKDDRDGHIYEVRKFKDGKCWMVDNLRYGGATTPNGTTDACEGKITATDRGMNTGTADTSSLPWYDENGNPMYGDCIDPSNPNIPVNFGGGTQKWNTCLGKTDCGYKYNWQAAIQQPNCNYNNSACSFSAPTTNSNFVQGVCPAGWHVPSGGTTGAASNSVALDLAIGGNGTGSSSSSSDALKYFWHAYGGAGWKFYPAGWVSNSANSAWGGYYHNSWNQYGQRGHWWSATSQSVTNAYDISVREADYWSVSVNGKWNGHSVRCVGD